MNINDACDYIIERMSGAGSTLNLLKLQKLLYYVQGWHLAFYKAPLFEGKFQAWVHGPVNREIYDRFRHEKSLYSTVDTSDLRLGYSSSQNLSAASIQHINSVLDTYGCFTGDQLEYMTHQEDPWVQARGDLESSARCESEIDERTMATYYSSRLQ
ncbi:Panacea domain-containing protein [Sedimenticola selenatireducens]|uniref:DUF4065 domain-containing protein n=1 Tax=Sedimenticola selenatireducens TaxID=191960 RepID=A0A557SM07_9GAMM|nr:type II toxin-antitoxin system antitoxin SocA domain-containing protein [Sedimenticola selenatireducens]TVO78453.1 DUF4065 domain-containing protein [Sedimenticola selenatireducens]TVT62688.1 MAG: DUF4065 domain-containing protein [Sedimenticola selenatireducens]